MTIDINCDLGESQDSYETGNDDAIMPYITSANIACGFHAGNPLIIEKTIQSAIRNGVSIGAHPGYADIEGFGRRAVTLSNEELRASVIYQVGAMKAMVETSGEKLHHVKPHGALYNSAATDFDMALVIARAIRDIDSSLILYALSGSALVRAARETGLTVASEVFADRAYNDDGTLLSRNFPGAIINETGKVIEQAIKMITENRVVTITGKEISITADTICLHGDNPMAPEFARSLGFALIKGGIELKSIGKL